jgi:hypothetical protein
MRSAWIGMLVSSCLLLPVVGCSSTKDEANEAAEEAAEEKGTAHLSRVDNPEEGVSFIHASVIRSTNQTFMPTKGFVCISYADEVPNVRSGVELQVANPGKENYVVTLKVVDPDEGCDKYHDKGVPRFTWNEVD